MNRSHLAVALALMLMLVAATKAFAAPPRMTLNGQLAALADEVKKVITEDPLLKNQKLKFGKVGAPDLPESNYELRLEQEFKRLLGDVLGATSDFTLVANYDYLEADNGDNKGHKVVQVSLAVKDAKRREVAAFTREINETADIARILGQTMAPPDSADFNVRNKAAEEAFAKPAFATHAKRPTAIMAVGMAMYAVEIRKQKSDDGPVVAVTPTTDEGRAFAPIDVSEAYEVVLLNYDTQFDAIVRLEIDGLDAVNTFNEDGVKYPGYFVPRAKGEVPGEHVIPGWLRTVKSKDADGLAIKSNVYQFVVNQLGQGAASSLGVRSGIGVITAQFFDAAKPGETMRARSFGETGAGKGMKIGYDLAEVQMGSQPLSTISVRYTRSPKE